MMHIFECWKIVGNCAVACVEASNWWNISLCSVEYHRKTNWRILTMVYHNKAMACLFFFGNTYSDSSNDLSNITSQSERFDSCDPPSNLNQIGFKSIFLAHMTLKFDGWSRQTIGHLFYDTSSFVHHFKAIGLFKLELQSQNIQFW